MSCNSGSTISAHFAFTGLAHPHVDDRIVITSSIAHKSGAMDYSDLPASRSYPDWARYQMSKLANLLHMFELDRRLGAAGRATQAIGCHPGVALTELTRHLPAAAAHDGPAGSAPFFNSAAQGAHWPTLQAATGARVRRAATIWGHRGSAKCRAGRGPRARRAMRAIEAGARAVDALDRSDRGRSGSLTSRANFSGR